MRFVIVGGGRVGMRTARVLREEDHEIVLIETDRNRVERLTDEGFTVIHGDGSDDEILHRAGIMEADGLAGLAGDLFTNFIACLVAKEYGCRTVLRINSDDREFVIRRYSDAVDAVVYPEQLGAIAAKNTLVGGNVHAIADIAPHLQLVELKLTESSPMIGYSMAELELPARSRVLAFGKADQALELPDADKSLEKGDRLIVIAEFKVLQEVEQIIVGEINQVPASKE